MKKSRQDGLLIDHTSNDLMHLYVLTPSVSDVTSSMEQSDLREEGIHVNVVRADHRIASFYRAKQNLDNLEISNVTLLCDARAERYWNYVCQDMFTPVYEWEVKVVNSPVQKETVSAHTPDRATKVINHVVQAKTSSNREHSKTESSKHNGLNPESSTCDDLSTDSSVHNAVDAKSLIYGTVSADSSEGGKHDGVDVKSTNPDAMIREESPETKYRIQNVPEASELDECSAESVRGEIRSFLQTLPSLLGLPEAERSRALPGVGEGFVHGYSTRRGGVTTLPTLCAMNPLYTDKKRDSRLVAEENIRRLSLVGGFDPQTFHTVRVEHGHKVWTVGEEEPPIKYDALVTNRRDVTIAAVGADCIALLFADPVAMAIGAAHAGWLGSVERVAACVVKTMGERFGSRPEDIRVSLGPGLRLGCFKVLEEEGKMFAQIHPSCQTDSVQPACHLIDATSLQKDEAPGCEIQGEDLHEDGQYDDQVLLEPKKLPSKEVKTENGEDYAPKVDFKAPIQSTQASQGEETRSSSRLNSVKNRPSTTLSKRLLNNITVEQVPAEQLKPKAPREPKSSGQQWTFVDLQMTNYHVLLQAGVKAEHIDMSTSHCTKCNPDLYFSYERDGFPFGNQVGFICMPSGCLEG
ncbi:hypothetical protein ACOMHN_042251 [Nucella lapillus]